MASDSYKHGQFRVHVNYLTNIFRCLRLYIIVQQASTHKSQNRLHVCTLPVTYDKLPYKLCTSTKLLATPRWPRYVAKRVASSYNKYQYIAKLGGKFVCIIFRDNLREQQKRHARAVFHPPLVSYVIVFT